jgi:hypothetical protein
MKNKIKKSGEDPLFFVTVHKQETLIGQTPVNGGGTFCSMVSYPHPWSGKHINYLDNKEAQQAKRR